jgi:N-6 DNA Methylase
MVRSNEDASYIKVMESVGFYRGGEPASGIIDAEDLRTANNEQIDKRIKYSAVIDRNKLNATAIFELSGSPCIYFTRLGESDSEKSKLAKLHRLAWNQGLAPMLWIVTPTDVRLYNCYSKPTSTDESNPDQHLIALFKQTEQGLQQLHDFADRLQIESGAFWQKDQAKRINRRQRVDVSLLENLRKAEARLVARGLEHSVAQALLGRSIFISYLHDRGILTPEFFLKTFHYEKVVDIFTDKTATYTLFAWIQQTFNGSLFPLEYIQKNGSVISEYDIIQTEHLKVVQDFLFGKVLETGQVPLWPYNFDVIPVELISSIYEMFIHADNSLLAKERSTYYTPINLVDLVLSEVCNDLSANANVLDLSCGSGVFLVEMLRRLVAKRIGGGAQWSRAMVREVLYKQIYGIDISKDAVQLAAFSLYLTALELDPDPQLSDALKFRPLIGHNLFAADAFDEQTSFNIRVPFITKNFQAIVGNPPWSRNKTNQLATEYCIKRNYTINPRSLDQAFLWRAGDFANAHTRLGFILHSRPFFGHTELALKARRELLTRFRPQVIVNLSDLRQDGLFPRSDAPAMVLIAYGSHTTKNDSFYFVNAEHSKAFKKHSIIEIGPENVTSISTQNVMNDTDVLKVASWGSARDMALIAYLRDTFPSLEKFIDDNASSDKGWKYGQGFQKANGKTERPELYSKKWLPSNEMRPFLVDMDDLGFLPVQQMHRPRDPEIYKAPLVITTRGIIRKQFFAAFSSEDVVYTEQYFGISVPQEQEYLAHYLNALFNSSLATYFLFMTASVWGVERDKVEPNDVLRLPIPKVNDHNKELVQRILTIEGQLCLSNSEAVQEELCIYLNRAVFELYGLDEAEKILIQDAVNFTIDLRMNREKSAALKPPQQRDMVAYARQLISVIQPFFQTLNEQTLVADILDTGQSPLYVARFSLSPVSLNRPFVEIVKESGLNPVLQRIAALLPQKIADTIFTQRILRIYTGRDFYIVKPAQHRYWTRSAGLNDADIVLSEHLRSGYASIK